MTSSTGKTRRKRAQNEPRVRALRDIQIGKGKVEVAVTAFGQMCLDNIGATITEAEAVALGAAWIRVGTAIREHQYGKVLVTDRDGDEILYVGMDYKTFPFDMKRGLPLLQEFKCGK
jgi:hypothetical protein